MTTKRSANNGRKGAGQAEETPLPDDFPAELVGDFATIPGTFWKNYGTVAGLVLARGGYIGLSITDDAGSGKLAVRCPRVSFDKRVYKFKDLETLVVYCLNKLTA